MPQLDLTAFHDAYDKLQLLPGNLGKRVFERVAGVLVPHAAKMGFRIQKLDEKQIAVTMPDRRGNRNHLRSIHAMALAHLGEFTCGCLLLYAVSPYGYRTIITKYTIEYLKKARGTITGKASVKLPKSKDRLDAKDFTVTADLVDETGVVVARVETVWRIGKMPKS
jgi:acyl-coenzyme A thioesterase PaaI-like protein